MNQPFDDFATTDGSVDSSGYNDNSHDSSSYDAHHHPGGFDAHDLSAIDPATTSFDLGADPTHSHSLHSDLSVESIDPTADLGLSVNGFSDSTIDVASLDNHLSSHFDLTTHNTGLTHSETTEEVFSTSTTSPFSSTNHNTFDTSINNAPFDANLDVTHSTHHETLASTPTTARPTAFLSAPSCSSDPITPDSRNGVELTNHGTVWWHGSGMGQAGKIRGHKYYDTSDHYIGKLGSDLKVYDANGRQVGYVTPSGCAYTTHGQLFVKGETARWAAATFVFNVCHND